MVAEGVETERQLSFLRAQRCDFAQGHLFGRPLEGEALTDYVHSLAPEITSCSSLAKQPRA